MNRSRALLCAFAAVIIWGSNAVIIRHLVQDGVTASAIAFLRVLVGGAILIPWILTDKSRSIGIRMRKPWLWLGIACYGGNMLVFHAALNHANAASVMLLENIAPAVTLFGAAVFFGNRVTGKSIAALLLAGGGVILICGVGAGETMSISGIIFGISSGITWGGYMISCQGREDSAGESGGHIAVLCFTMLCSAIILIPPLLTVDVKWPSKYSSWGLIVLLGVVHTALATLLWEKAVAALQAYVASLLFLLTIVITFVFSDIFLNEPVTAFMAIGGIAIAVSAATASMDRYAGRHSSKSCRSEDIETQLPIEESRSDTKNTHSTRLTPT